MIRQLLNAILAVNAGAVAAILHSGADANVRAEDGTTPLMMVKEKHYVDVINLLHEKEQESGEGQGCSTPRKPGENVVTFHKPGSRH